MAKNTLQKLHLTSEQLSAITRKQLKEAAECSQFRYVGQHPIKEAVSDAHVALEAAKLAMQESTIKRRIRAVTKRDSDIKEQIAVFQRELALVNDEKNTLKEETDKKQCAAKVCASKAVRLSEVLQQSIKERTESGMPDERKYKSILENYEKLKAMKAEMARLQEEIQNYDELPPDLGQASKVLWAAKQEHGLLLQQISDKIHSTNSYK